MAKLDPTFSFTGRLGNLSAYRMKGIKETILRTIGGPSPDKIKHDPKYENHRRRNKEFGGRSTGSKGLRSAIFPIKHLADYNFTHTFNSMNTVLQRMDTVSEPGKRSVCFTKYPKLYEGFNLNRLNPFDSIVRHSLSFEFNKESLTARIDFPALLPGINFFVPPANHPAYSFIAAIGIVPDVVFSQFRYEPLDYAASGMAMSAWYPVSAGSPAISLEPVFPPFVYSHPPASPFTLVLSVGICFGTMAMNNEMRQVENAGAAKILSLA